MTKHAKNHALTLAILLPLILADQLSKFLATRFLDVPFNVFGDFDSNFLVLEKSMNPGVAFGIQFHPLLILAATILLLILIVRFAHTELNLRKPLARLTLVLILSGGIGNLIDRLVYGKVVDFIAFSFWPSFNLADVFIVVGVVLAVGYYKKIKHPKHP